MHIKQSAAQHRHVACLRCRWCVATKKLCSSVVPVGLSFFWVVSSVDLSHSFSLRAGWLSLSPLFLQMPEPNSLSATHYLISQVRSQRQLVLAPRIFVHMMLKFTEEWQTGRQTKLVETADQKNTFLALTHVQSVHQTFQNRLGWIRLCIQVCCLDNGASAICQD